MSIFSKLGKYFSPKKGETVKYLLDTSGNFVMVDQHGTRYSDDLMVQSCISSIASEISKLEPHHVRRNEQGEIERVYDDIDRVLQRPNYMMTTHDFLEKIVWTLYLNSNAFVLPQYDALGNLRALWPFPEAEYTLKIDNTNTTFLEVEFKDGEKWAVKYDSVIHMRKDFSVNEYFGGNRDGKANYKALEKALSVNNSLVGGLEKALSISQAVGGIVKVNTTLKEKNQEELIATIQRRLKDPENNFGILTMDTKWDFVPIKRDIMKVDKATIDYLEERVLNFFGCSRPILSGNFTMSQYEAFYQKTLEPLCVMISQAFTKALFTMRSSTSYGHAIRMYNPEIRFTTISQKLEAIRLIGDQGGMYLNEARELIGLPAIPALNGKMMQSLNYIESDKASSYQMGTKDKDEDEPPKKDEEEPVDDGGEEDK